MRLIDADALRNKLGEVWGIPKDWDGDMDQTCEDAFTLIDDADTIEAVPVVHGEWVRKHIGNGWDDWDALTCSVCDKYYEKPNYPTNYCPNCGADMRTKEK